MMMAANKRMCTNHPIEYTPTTPKSHKTRRMTPMVISIYLKFNHSLDGENMKTIEA